MEEVKMSVLEESLDRESASSELKCEVESTDIDQVEEMLACPDCKERFWEEEEFQEHLEKHRSGLICPTCGYEGRDKSVMISHSRDHLDLSSVQCLLCKERLTDVEKMDLHLSGHASKMSSCPWCAYVSSAVPELSRHLELHLNTFRVNCNYCKYYSFSEADLKAHSEVHEDSRSRFRKKWEGERSPQPCSALDTPPPDLGRLLDRALFRCGVCGGQQKTEAQLLDHAAEHARPRCPHCHFEVDHGDIILDHVLHHLQTASAK